MLAVASCQAKEAVGDAGKDTENDHNRENSGCGEASCIPLECFLAPHMPAGLAFELRFHRLRLSVFYDLFAAPKAIVI
jgi:hypothetical protein